MTEELYIIKNGQRVALDLCTPSGVTLVFASNLFADLSKIDCSHSYTFKLPATQNNARAFELVADLRYDSPLYGLRIPCEYWRDGVPIASPANLYVSEINGGEYSAVMTFAIIEGLQAINDADVSIKALGDTTNPETIMFGTTGGSGSRNFINFDTYCDPTNYDNSVTQTPFYYAGVASQKSGLMPPVVPLHLLLTKIQARYGLNIDFADAYDYDAWHADILQGKTPPFVAVAGVPMVTTQLGNEYVEHQSLDFHDVRELITETLTFTNRQGTVTHTIDNVLRWSSFSWSANMDYFEIYDMQYHRELFKPKRSNVCMRISGNLVVRYSDTQDEPPHLLVFRAGYRGVANIAEIEGETVADESSPDYNKVFSWDFREEEGFTPYDCEIVGDADCIGFALDETPDTLVEGSLSVSPYFEEGAAGHPCRVFECLPDISCFTLLKSLFYVLGGFPKITAGGGIGISYYTELRDNIAAGNVYDWTGCACIDYGANPDTLKYTNGNLGQRNHLLMKNESLERQEVGKTDDIYDAPAFVLTCANGTLEKDKTLHQFPFYGRYIRNGQHHSMATGNTIKYWDVVDNKYVANEALPAIGKFYIDESLYTSQGNWLYWGVWQAGDDNEQYDYLQTIIRKPYVVKIPVRLALPVLVGIDYTRPVYIGQLNAYFAIMTLTMDGNGNTTAELIKLP